MHILCDLVWWSYCHISSYFMRIILRCQIYSYFKSPLNPLYSILEYWLNALLVKLCELSEELEKRVSWGWTVFYNIMYRLTVNTEYVYIIC